MACGWMSGGWMGGFMSEITVKFARFPVIFIGYKAHYTLKKFPILVEWY